MPVKDVVIGKADKTVKYRNEFVVTAKFKHSGDADETIIVVVDGTQKAELIEFLNFLEASDAALKRNEFHDSVVGYAKFGDAYEDEYIFGLECGWPCNSTNGVCASYRGSTVGYFDSDGTLHHVDII